jgi:hypothetical protein
LAAYVTYRGNVVFDRMIYWAEKRKLAKKNQSLVTVFSKNVDFFIFNIK